MYFMLPQVYGVHCWIQGLSARWVNTGMYCKWEFEIAEALYHLSYSVLLKQDSMGNATDGALAISTATYCYTRDDTTDCDA